MQGKIQFFEQQYQLFMLRYLFIGKLRQQVENQGIITSLSLSFTVKGPTWLSGKVFDP